MVQLTYTRAFRSAEFTAELWPWVLISQVVQCITIITSCIPYLRPLLESFPSGMFMSDELSRKGTIHASSHGYVRTPDRSYILRPVQSNIGKIDRSPSQTKLGAHSRFTGFETTTVTTASTIEEAHNESTGLSEDRGAAGNAHIIKTTTFSTS